MAKVIKETLSKNNMGTSTIIELDSPILGYVINEQNGFTSRCYITQKAINKDYPFAPCDKAAKLNYFRNFWKNKINKRNPPSSSFSLGIIETNDGNLFTTKVDYAFHPFEKNKLSLEITQFINRKIYPIDHPNLTEIARGIMGIEEGQRNKNYGFFRDMPKDIDNFNINPPAERGIQLNYNKPPPRTFPEKPTFLNINPTKQKNKPKYNNFLDELEKIYRP